MRWRRRQHREKAFPCPPAGPAAVARHHVAPVLEDSRHRQRYHAESWALQASPSPCSQQPAERRKTAQQRRQKEAWVRQQRTLQNSIPAIAS